MDIKIFKNKKSFKKGGFHSNPNISWEFVLWGSLTLVLASFVFGFYLFAQTNKEFILPATDAGRQIPTINKDRILKVLNYFSEREKKSVEILNSSTLVVDPSL